MTALQMGTRWRCFWKAFYHGQLETSTRVQNALALDHSDQVHRKEPKIHLRLKTMVSDAVEDQQQHSLTCSHVSNRKRPGERQNNPSPTHEKEELRERR